MNSYRPDSNPLANRSPTSNNTLLTTPYDSTRDFATPQFNTYPTSVPIFENSRGLDHSSYAPRSENTLQVAGQTSMDPSSGPVGSQITIRLASEFPLDSRNTVVHFGNQVVSTKVSTEGAFYIIMATVPHGIPHYQPVEVLVSDHNGNKMASYPTGSFFVTTGSVSDQSHGHGSSSPVSPPGAPSRISIGDHYEVASTSQVTPIGSYGTTASAYQEPSASSMMGYRTPSYASHMNASSHVMRPPPVSTSWSFNSPIDNSNPAPIPMRPAALSVSIHGVDDGTISTRLIRSSMISHHLNNHGYPNNHPSAHHKRVELITQQPVHEMTHNWSGEEFAACRRIVLFSRTLRDDAIEINFRPVSSNERRPPGSAVVSCIYWREQDSFYITSVDTILLLEQLLVSPSRFTVEEKNRIRRNLEGFKPLTVGKAKPETEEFFKVIMGFSNPKPRNIEKDVKVFAWASLEVALKKIIGKYAMVNKPSELARMSNMNPPMSAPSYRNGSSPVSADSVSNNYGSVLPAPPSFHADIISSPRTNWSGYNTRHSPIDRTAATQSHNSIPSMDPRGMAGSNGASFIPSMHVGQPTHAGHQSAHVSSGMSANRWEAAATTGHYDTGVPPYGAPTYGAPGGLQDTHRS